ncbi:Asr1405/Asl0597 family protein [Myxosarcina sp. GI1(2024)]
MSQSDRFGRDKTQFSLKTDERRVVDTIWIDRWQIFHRLQALEITCGCATNQPLWARLDNVKTAIQIWSVVKQHSASRLELVDWLNRCWQIENYRNNC